MSSLLDPASYQLELLRAEMRTGFADILRLLNGASSIPEPVCSLPLPPCRESTDAPICVPGCIENDPAQSSDELRCHSRSTIDASVQQEVRLSSGDATSCAFALRPELSAVGFLRHRDSFAISSCFLTGGFCHGLCLYDVAGVFSLVVVLLRNMVWLFRHLALDSGCFLASRFASICFPLLENG
jgi:hypothetical protein